MHHDDAVYIDELNNHTVNTMLYEMQVESIHAAVFFHPDLEELKNAFWKKFKVLQAAGGLVENEKNEILMIYRRGHWDLPKGKLDDNESLEECAIREVMEETGLKKVKLVSPLLTTYHTYHEGTKHILKESYWYKMEAASDQGLTPQTEEDITEIKWKNLKGINKVLKEAYPSIIDVFEAYQIK
jgi:8-oxo-dGTP pyrophosphatase MutT (NUDIX family)